MSEVIEQQLQFFGDSHRSLSVSIVVPVLIGTDSFVECLPRLHALDPSPLVSLIVLDGVLDGIFPGNLELLVREAWVAADASVCPRGCRWARCQGRGSVDLMPPSEEDNQMMLPTQSKASWQQGSHAVEGRVSGSSTTMRMMRSHHDVAA